MLLLPSASCVELMAPGASCQLHTAVLINWDIPVVLLLLGHSYRLTIDLLLLTLTIVRLQFPLILPPAPSLCT